MRISHWFSHCFPPPPPRGGGGFSPRSCRRWERALYLAVSEDLPETTARAFGRHLSKCAGCREELARSIALRDRQLCLRSPARPSRGSLWPAIREQIRSRDHSPSLPEFPGRPRPGGGGGAGGRLVAAFSGRGAWPARVAALVLLGWFSWFSVMSFREERDSRVTISSRKVLEARWTARWDAFVSGESRGEINIDPFASEIPNPDVIDF